MCFFGTYREHGLKDMAVSKYFIWFIIFSVAGWIFECVYCTVRRHHWQNRGFLYGPLCPIYGVGLTSAMIAYNEIFDVPEGGAGYPVWLIFLVCAVASAVLEFVTSWVLEKCFHATWWDYSDIPLNFQGRISLPTTCGFGIAGTVFVKLVFPLIGGAAVVGNSVAYEILSLILAILLGMDLALTIESLTRLLQRMEEAGERFDKRMEESVQIIRQGPEAVGDAVKAQAKDAGETAVIAAMLAADAAKEKLSGRDRYHLRSIRTYRPKVKANDTADTAKRLRQFFEELQKRAGKH